MLDYGPWGAIIQHPEAAVVERLPLGVVGDRLPVDQHASFVSDNPCIMTRRDDHEIARSDLQLLAVVHKYRHASGDAVAHVRNLATVRSGNRLDVKVGPQARDFSWVKGRYDLAAVEGRTPLIAFEPMR